MNRVEMRVFSEPTELAEGAATDWVGALAAVLSEQDAWLTALSGGRIAGTFFDALARAVRDGCTPLGGVHFFWADERCVPPDDPESNYRLAKARLLDPLQVAGNQVHRLAGELPPAEAARQAADELRRVAPLNAHHQPVLDLVVLGMGEDGHVASLFPEEPAAMINDPAPVRAVVATKPPPQRLTLGYPVLLAAREVWVLASGTGKTAALARSLDPQGDTPLARVIQHRRRTRIYTDIELPASAA